MAPTAVSLDKTTSLPAAKSTLPEDGSHVHGTEDNSPLAAISHGDNVLPGIPRFDSFEAQRQWQLEHMAAAFRHWSREGYVVGMTGHISVRDPEHENVMWINPSKQLGVHFGLLNASDMIAVNMNDGTIVGGNRSRPPNAAGFLIHSECHRARPDVHAICHAHSIHGKAWSSFGKPIEMLTQDACKFYKAHSVYDSYGGVVFVAEEGKCIARALGQNKACILRNHGLLTVGQTVDEAAFLFLTLEHSCQGQLLAEAAAANGISKALIPDEEAAYTYMMESDPEVCYCEFQVYYDFEDRVLKGEFKQ
ncbi:hypothetical protein PHISCL_04136 [Aspergillus sclerotialis]|uniref:Class II aldolase/adducin N-terminal domain-containing protein n=1 Tax=Aspergillus sclerotialis TaxID=2070753 RepID=A0A3A2ZK38_9EURO|nr:hypothetical protein PHISCL_04136 [Aspergillus sclerotialis]